MVCTVEGFESQLLEYLSRHAREALCAVRVMAIEWHEKLLTQRPRGWALKEANALRQLCPKTTFLMWH